MRFVSRDLEIWVNTADFVSLSEKVRARFSSGLGFALATINLDHLVKIRRDPVFAKAYAAHDLIVADGNPIVWLSALAGISLRLVPGSDAVLPLAKIATEQSVPVVLIGSTEENLQRAEKVLVRRTPGLKVALRIAPPMGFDPQGGHARLILDQIADLGPVLCFVALGAPKQEVFAALGRELAPQAGFASVGAALDFLSGGQLRAPGWVRKLALEWLWRAFSAPRRLIPRYIACLAILPVELVNALQQRFERPRG